MLRVSLSEQISWNPPNILTSELASLRFKDFPLQPLDLLVEIYRDREMIPKGTKILSANSLNDSGTWSSKISKSEYLGSSVNNFTGLCLNDLVLYPGRPPLRITTEESGLAFVGNFMVLRPKSASISLWLWGLFNTTNGRSWLKGMASVNGSVAPRFSDTLLSALVASTEAKEPSFLANLRALSKSVADKVRDVRYTEATSGSWFRRMCIDSGADWSSVFVSDTALSSFEGVPLETFLESIEVGKVISEMPKVGDKSLALVSHRTLSTGEYGSVTCKSGVRPLKSGTLVVSTIGHRSLAAVTERDAILGKGVVALHLKAGVDPYWIRDFFNSDTAQIQRRALVKGVAVPFLTKTALREFTIPDVFDIEPKSSQTLSEACDVIFRQ
jgi:hypothetical protein